MAFRNSSRKSDARSSTPGRTQSAPTRAWSDREVTTLKKLVSQNTPTRVMGIKLSRTPGAIYSKAAALGISLKPTNQRPYG